MTPATQPRKPRNSSKVNLTISLVFHGLIVAALVFFAAREGLLGKQLKKLAVTMVKKEKPPEKPKEPEKPKIEPPKIEEPKVAVVPKIAPPTQAPPPSTTAVAPAVAPPTVNVPQFDFAGGVEVKTGTAVDIYKDQVQSILLSRWNRPEDMDDAKFVAEVDLTVDSYGQLGEAVWKKGSGNKRWDDSVRQALAATKSMNTKPPANFPSHFTVLFDVHSDGTESIVP